MSAGIDLSKFVENTDFAQLKDRLKRPPPDADKVTQLSVKVYSGFAGARRGGRGQTDESVDMS